MVMTCTFFFLPARPQPYEVIVETIATAHAVPILGLDTCKTLFRSYLLLMTMGRGKSL